MGMHSQTHRSSMWTAHHPSVNVPDKGGIETGLAISRLGRNFKAFQLVIVAAVFRM